MIYSLTCPCLYIQKFRVKEKIISKCRLLKFRVPVLRQNQREKKKKEKKEKKNISYIYDLFIDLSLLYIYKFQENVRKLFLNEVY